MDITKRIATNLSIWMDAHPTLDTIKKISLRSGVGFGTIRRTRNGDGNITVQNLELIAKAFKRRAADLLVEQKVSLYETAASPTNLFAEERQADEQEIITGYRAASDDIKDLMLQAARRAIANSRKTDKEYTSTIFQSITLKI